MNSKTVLIVEDEETLRSLLVEKFSENGFTVLEAGTGSDGLAHAIEGKPDIILLDLLMPEMDGYEMLKKLRKDPLGISIPVIVITNFGTNEMREMTDAYHVADFINKLDATPDTIVQKVIDVLETNPEV